MRDVRDKVWKDQLLSGTVLPGSPARGKPVWRGLLAMASCPWLAPSCQQWSEPEALQPSSDFATLADVLTDSFSNGLSSSIWKVPG